MEEKSVEGLWERVNKLEDRVNALDPNYPKSQKPKKENFDFSPEIEKKKVVPKNSNNEPNVGTYFKTKFKRVYINYTYAKRKEKSNYVNERPDRIKLVFEQNNFNVVKSKAEADIEFLVYDIQDEKSGDFEKYINGIDWEKRPYILVVSFFDEDDDSAWDWLWDKNNTHLVFVLTVHKSNKNTAIAWKNDIVPNEKTLKTFNTLTNVYMPFYDTDFYDYTTNMSNSSIHITIDIGEMHTHAIFIADSIQVAKRNQVIASNMKNKNRILLIKNDDPDELPDDILNDFEKIFFFYTDVNGEFEKEDIMTVIKYIKNI